MSENDHCILEGQLDGIGWEERYFRLTPHVLEFYTPTERQLKSGTITLNNISDISSLNTGTGREIAIRCPGRNYILRAPTAAEAEGWRDAIHHVVKETKGGEDVSIRKPSIMTNFKSLETCVGQNHMLSSTFESLEMDQTKKDYIEQHFLRKNMLQVLMACSEARPTAPLQWISEALRHLALSVEEEAGLHHNDTVEYTEGWRWYIYAAEREIDFINDTTDHTLPVEPSLLACRTFEQSPAVVNDYRRFTAFVPKCVLALYERGKIKTPKIIARGSHRPVNPIIVQKNAVMVSICAQGFTSLTEKLSRSVGGPEEMSPFLNLYFSRIKTLVRFFGGDVVRYTGDIVTLIWVADGKNNTPTCPHVAIYRCCQACLHINKEIEDYETPVADVKFSFHTGLGYGQVSILQFGGIFEQWRFSVAGEPKAQISVAEKLASSGEICLSPEAARLLTEACSAFNIKLGKFQSTGGATGFVILSSLQEVSHLQKKATERNDLLGSTIDSRLFRKYVTTSLWRCLESKQDFSEGMRPCTVVSLLIEGLDSNLDEGAMMSQLLVTCVQRSTFALEGQFFRILIDHEGIKLTSVFGISPWSSHFGDDPIRGVIAGMRMLDALRAEDVSGRVGVASGRVWAGVSGVTSRKDHVVLGEVIDLSGRIQQKAIVGQILCCQETAETLRKYNFELCKNISKNFYVIDRANHIAVQLVEPTGRIMKWKQPLLDKYIPSRLKGHKYCGDLNPLFQDFWEGTQEVRTLNKNIIEQLRGHGGINVLSGAAGCGKGMMIATLASLKKQYGFTLLTGDCLNPTGTHQVPFLCWLRIFTSLGEELRRDTELVKEVLGEEDQNKPVCLRDLVSQVVSDHLKEWLPLLSKVMTCLGFSGTLVKAQLEADLRSPKRNMLRAIAMDVLDWYTRRRPTVVVLHLKQCSALRDEPDKRLFPFAKGICELIINRKREGFNSAVVSETASHGTAFTGPEEPLIRPNLVFVVCCRTNENQWNNPTFKWIRSLAEETNHHTIAHRMNSEQIKKYVGHFYGAKDCFLPKEVLDHFEEVTNGNLRLIDVVAEDLIQHGICNLLGYDQNPIWKPSPGTLLEQRLLTLPYPESIFVHHISIYDRLSVPQEQIVQTVAKLLATLRPPDTFLSNMLTGVMEGCDRTDCSYLENCFTIPMVQTHLEAKGAAENDEIEREIKQLTEVQIFHKIENTDEYRFFSRYWKFVAETLVLQTMSIKTD